MKQCYDCGTLCELIDGRVECPKCDISWVKAKSHKQRKKDAEFYSKFCKDEEEKRRQVERSFKDLSRKDGFSSPRINSGVSKPKDSMKNNEGAFAVFSKYSGYIVGTLISKYSGYIVGTLMGLYGILTIVAVLLKWFK